MRTVAIGFAMIVAAGLAAGLANAGGGGAIGFDHNVHDRDVVVSGVESLPCARCHTARAGLLIGRPGHAACFTGCHGGPPVKPKRGTKLAISAELKPVCTACHAESALAAPMAGTLAVAFPPYKLDADFALTIGHKRHAAITCASCHTGKAGPSHKRCASCHDGAKLSGHGPAMALCQGCHQPGSGAPEPPRMAVATNTVTSTFSHPKHAARGGVGARCMTCHGTLSETDDNILPRPTAANCAIGGCHDGKPTFGVTANCTRCHQKPPPGQFDVARPAARFSHAIHNDTKLGCTSCHVLGKTGEALAAGHAACASCHADDFGKRRPTTCGACHNATEPWRPLVADRLPPDHTEFGASLDHRTHTQPCVQCHSLTTAGAQLRPPRGHRACSGRGCHGVTGGRGPSPDLNACEGCHQLGLAMKRAAVRAEAPWSVRAAFDHAPHRIARDGSTVACTSCHATLDAPSLVALPAPTKATCAPCHDGSTAFKLTGTTCSRCHATPTGAKRP